MTDVNNVTLIGRLTRDAELKYIANGTAVVKFSLAVNERRKSGDQWKDEANFFDIVLWGQLGESLSQYLTKGKQVAVVGRLTQERWEQDGYSRQRVIVTARDIELLGSPSGGNGEQGQNYGPASRQSAARPGAAPGSLYTTPEPRRDSTPDVDDGFAEDIPF
jgi:single-strand DNA-binding protein